MRHTLSVLLSIVAISTQPVRAQSPAERALLARWDDSIAMVEDGAALDRFAAAASQGTTAAKDLRTAMIQIRRGALTNTRSDIELGLIRINSVAAGHRKWPWPDYLMARQFYEYNGDGVDFKASAGVRDGLFYVDAAIEHLANALATDPEMPEARALAIRMMLAEGDRTFHGQERAMIHAMLLRGTPEADLYLLAARDARARRHYDTASTWLDRALAAGGDRSRLQLERARVRYALADARGATAAYWDGLQHLSATGRAMYRYDLAWVLAPDSLGAMDRVPDDSLEGWLRSFWARRDAEAADLPGARLLEHFRRRNVALDLFRVAMPERHNQFARIDFGIDAITMCIPTNAQLYDLLAREQPSLEGDPRHKEPLLDNRGLIYLHHGPPYRIVYGATTPPEPPGVALTNPPPPRPPAWSGTHVPLTGPPTVNVRSGSGRIPGLSDACQPLAVKPNESWLYWFSGTWRVMNFRGTCALGNTAPTTLTSFLPPQWDKEWETRSNLTPDYAAAAEEIFHPKEQLKISCHDSVLPMLKRSLADADVATRTDSHTPFVPRPWNAVIQAFGLGAGVDGSGEALVTYAIPFDSLTATRRANGTTTFKVAARVVGYDLKSGRTFSVDTVREFSPPRQGAGAKGHVSGWFEFAVDPGDWQIAVRMWQPGDSLGAYNLISPVRVDAAAPLMISDLVTGGANGTSWPAPDGVVYPLAVLGAWPVGSTADLYYEVRGLSQGTAYQSVVTVSDTTAKSNELVRIDATDHATGAVSTVRKSLGLAQLKPGMYRVTVTITHGTDRATRTRQIYVVKP